MSFQIVLIPNHDVGQFLKSIPELLNSAQSEFCFSLRDIQSNSFSTHDADKILHDLYELKTQLKICDEDLLIQFIGSPLSIHSKGYTNLFLACTSISESPPRVAAVSTSFIRRHILPVDPTYLTQRNAFYHLFVCCLAGSFLEMDAHEDRGCLLDFNSYTPNIQRKLAAGYSFCEICAAKIAHHDLGRSLLDICATLKNRATSLASGIPELEDRPRIFLCYAGADRDKVADLFKRLHDDGFDPWMDKESLLPGQDWKLEIKRAVNNADYFIACLSSSFQNRTYAHKEIKLALDFLDELPEGQIYLIPARLEDCAINDRLSDRQWVDLFEDDGYDKLIRGLRWNTGDSDIIKKQEKQTANTETKVDELKKPLIMYFQNSQIKLGDKVIATEDLTFANGTRVGAGTTGTVKDEFKISGAYLVQFDGINQSYVVKAESLELFS